MPEGDAVWRTARRLHVALAGQVLTASDLRVPRLATSDLSGRATLEVVPRGKHLLHRVEGDLTLHSHLRMEGRWRLHRASRPPAAADRHTVRAVLSTSERVAIGDSLGMLDLVRTGQEDRVVGHLGPDLLDPAFDRDQALANVAGEPGRTITEALLDQGNLAGIGTIFASEPLFLHGVHPWATVADVGPAMIATLVDTARRLLVLSCRMGRTTITGRSDAVDDAWVHGRMGLPCKRCGDTIRVAPIGRQPRERLIFSCPTCQGGRAVTDDGSPQTPLGHARSDYLRR